MKNFKLLKALMVLAVAGAFVSSCNMEDHKKTTTVEEKKVETKEVKKSNSHKDNQ